MNLNRASSSMVLATFDLLDAEHPPPLADVLARHKRITDTQATTKEPGDLVAATIAALENGKDPAADAKVQRLIATRTVSDLGAQIEARLLEELNATLLAQADPILDAWAPHFDELAATLTATHTALRGLDPADTPAVLGLGGDAAQHWTTAKATLAKLLKICNGWDALAAICHVGPLDRRKKMLWACVPDAADVIAMELDGGEGSADLIPWRILDAGLTLELARPRQAVALIAAVAKARDDQWAAAQAEATRRPSFLAS